MPLRPYGENATLNVVLVERRRDMQTVNTLELTKVQGRDRTGIRATPSVFNDVIQDDQLGDIVNTATARYTLILLSGATIWSKVTQLTTF